MAKCDSCCCWSFVFDAALLACWTHGHLHLMLCAGCQNAIAIIAHCYTTNKATRGQRNWGSIAHLINSRRRCRATDCEQAVKLTSQFAKDQTAGHTVSLSWCGPAVHTVPIDRSIDRDFFPTPKFAGLRPDQTGEWRDLMKINPLSAPLGALWSTGSYRREGSGHSILIGQTISHHTRA